MTGGGFGGKEEYPNMIAAHAALLAKKAGRPVKMLYDRGEDMRATTKRHPAEIKVKVGADAEGHLTVVQVDLILDGGAYCTLSPVVLSRAVLHALSAYRCDHVEIKGKVMATNTPPNGAFRGFGAPQAIFGMERSMDYLAEKLGISPAEIRRRNHLSCGDSTATGQVLSEGVSAGAVLERTVVASDFDEKWRRYAKFQPGTKQRGIGISLVLHGCGFTGSGESELAGKASLTLALDEAAPEGVRAEIHSSSVDIGQGAATTFAQIAAEVLGLSYEAVVVMEPDTKRVPDSGPTVASRTCMIVGGLIEQAARACLEKLGLDGPNLSALQAALAVLGTTSASVTYESPAHLAWDEDHYRGSAYPVYGFACCVVEVEVDTVTFETEIINVVTAQDVGRAIHPSIVEGQIEGGTAQALGFAAFEEVVVRDGGMSNHNFSGYVLPTSMDLPRIEVLLHEEAFSGGPFGAKGVGEMPMDGPAPAYVAAVSQAMKAPFNEIPLTPERLSEQVIKKRGRKKRGAKKDGS